MMDIEEFREELENRLFIEKKYLVQQLSSMNNNQERLEILGVFNEKYRELIKRIARENGIDLNAPYPTDQPTDSESLSYEQIMIGKTMSIYDEQADKLYEEITSIH